MCLQPGPVFTSSTVARLRHVATISRGIRNALPSCASDVCPSRDRAVHDPAGQWVALIRSDRQRGRGVPRKNRSHEASFHSRERIAPSTLGVKMLECSLSRNNSGTIHNFSNKCAEIRNNISACIFEKFCIEQIQRRCGFMPSDRPKSVMILPQSINISLSESSNNTNIDA